MEGFVTQPHNQVCFAFQLKMLKRKQQEKKKSICQMTEDGSPQKDSKPKRTLNPTPTC